MRLDWSTITATAASIVESYDTPVTLRQLFYRLVAAEILPNTTTAYKTLSSRTAELRREGRFPDLSERTRVIHQASAFTGPQDALWALCQAYRRDRTEGQAYTVCIGVEKNGMVEQLTQWFGPLGLPVLALGGYASQSYVKEVRESVDRQGRPAVLLYGGDFEPSGEDIERDFLERVGCFAAVDRVVLTADQIRQYQLPPQPGKKTDSRASQFVERHGRLVQVELDALDANDLRGLYQEAVDRYWDMSAYDAVVAHEARERAVLEEVVV